MTLVLTSGALSIPVLWAEIEYLSVNEARAALARRENCTDLAAIGLWPGPAPRHSIGAKAIADWGSSMHIDAIVWTALKPKFNGISGLAPSSATVAIDYLRQLRGEDARLAEEYVRRAPEQIRTRYREQIESHLGWTSLGKAPSLSSPQPLRDYGQGSLDKNG